MQGHVPHHAPYPMLRMAHHVHPVQAFHVNVVEAAVSMDALIHAVQERRNV
jgi:hypothetical protein